MIPVFFNIAFAKVSNVTIRNNTFLGSPARRSDGSLNNFSEAINVEHEANNITINNNTFRGNDGDASHAHISLITFRDHGNSPLFENGVRDITITNNNFDGNVNVSIVGEEAADISIRNNNFTSPNTDINFFLAERGNRNINLSGNNFGSNRDVRITNFR